MKKATPTEGERYRKEEAIQKLEIEKQQKEPLAAKLRELGINHHKKFFLGYYIMNL